MRDGFLITLENNNSLSTLKLDKNTIKFILKFQSTVEPILDVSHESNKA